MFLSLAQKAGQRLMAGFDGQALNADLKFLIQTLKVGGIILFSRNLGSPDDIRQLCSDVQDYAGSSGQPPLIIASDQEGGQVARLKAPFFSEFPGNPAIKTRNDALNFARVTASELRSIGVNMNYAPVLDVTRPDIPGIMAGRSSLTTGRSRCESRTVRPIPGKCLATDRMLFSSSVSMTVDPSAATRCGSLPKDLPAMMPGISGRVTSRTGA